MVKQSSDGAGVGRKPPGQATPLARLWTWLGVAVAAVAGAVTVTAIARSHTNEAILRADPVTILAHPDLARAALAWGRKSFVAHCASCHGDGHGDPARGVPDLTDRDYLYGTGEVAEIEQIVLHGIRSGDPRGWHIAAMPAYARPLPYAAEPAIKPLSPSEIGDVTQYLLKGRATDPRAAARGRAIFAGRGACWDCHEPDGGGNSAVGAPNLNDGVWLYGDGSAAAIAATLARGRAGASPAFARVLSPLEVRSIAIYVASLPGRTRP